MAQTGLSTPSGARAQSIFEDQAVLLRATLPACIVNYVGLICYESASANQNDLRAFIWADASSLLYTSNTLTAAITSTNIATPYDAHITFTGANLAAGTYVFGAAGTGLGGTPVVSGQNGPGGTPVTLQNSNIYGSPPSPYTLGTVDSAATRTWGIYVDYTATGGGGGASNQRFFLLGVG